MPISWLAYNDKGIPFGIPKKPFFGFTKEELECLKLDEFSVVTCGSLGFLKINSDEISLQEYLGDFYSEIEITSNWKIVVENTLESFHVALIHPETFQKLGASGLGFTFSKDHSRWDAGVLMTENEGE